MDLYEYQGKQYFARFGIPVSPGGVADTVDEAVEQAEAAGYPVVIKAQVKVGGRGKAGGVKLAADADEVRLHAGNILGLDIKGHVVSRLWVEHASDIAKEYYASFTLDRTAKLHLGMLSARGRGRDRRGGTDRSRGHRQDPHRPGRGPLGRGGPRVGGPGQRSIPRRASRRRRCWCACTTVTSKATATWPRSTRSSSPRRARCTPSTPRSRSTRTPSFRHPEWEEYEDDADIDPREKMAKEKGLNYIGLSGTVGIIANGAGLAMSTLDVVTQVGGQAANFLDIGGGANADVMAAALEVINADPAVKSIFVNIFGGITRVDEVAKGIIEAFEPGAAGLTGGHAPRRHQRRAGPGPAEGPPLGPPDRRADDARRSPPRRGPGPAVVDAEAETRS